MADEHTDATEEATYDAEESSTEEHAVDDAPEPTSEATDHHTADELHLHPELLAVREENRDTVGQLVLHYAARDVAVVLDGDAALRVLTMFKRRSGPGMGDLLSPLFSSARNGWLVLDLEEPLAMSWIPATRSPRTSIDPVIPHAA